MPGLAAFLADHDNAITRVRRQVPLHLVGVLTAQAHRPIVFDDLAGHPGWRLVDQLFVNRAA